MLRALIFVLVIAGGTVRAQQTTFFHTDGVAIRGYDPVAYFLANKPVAGDKAFSFRWQEVDWYFSSQANLDKFKEAPDKYAPQFGGYCAYGVSDNHKSPTQPEAFTIVDGKLYLNYNPKVKELWLKDTEGHIRRAETNWAELKDKKE